VEFTVGRLKRTNGRKLLEMIVNSGMNDAFKNLRNEVEVGDRTVAG
jgi:hypothetical protein